MDADIKKMLVALMNGQSAIRGEIRQLEDKLSDKIDQVEKKLTKRIDSLG